MTAMLSLSDWVNALERYYLAEYVRGGGSSVKFAVCFDGVRTDQAIDALIERARTLGYLAARIDSREVKVHMIEKLFGSIVKQLPWDDLTLRVLLEFARQNHWLVPDRPTTAGLVEQLEQLNGLGTQQISLELQRCIGEGIFRDRSLAKDFRLAMLWLARARLVAAPGNNAIRDQILEWLRVEVRAISAMKQYQIFTKINRANARHLLGSLLAWIRRAGYPGLVVGIDAGRLLQRQRVDDGTLNYSPAALLDAYEVMRQFIDATDEFDGLLLVVSLGEEFLDIDPRGRGIGRYPALMYRAYDEVRDRNLANPLTALTRLAPREEVLA
ncbi:MAG: ATP-binding protein [Acidimicrobiales bacterium]|nr:ATP-binding protein [Acidimicrobiales bacterium]